MIPVIEKIIASISFSRYLFFPSLGAGERGSLSPTAMEGKKRDPGNKVVIAWVHLMRRKTGKLEKIHSKPEEIDES